MFRFDTAVLHRTLGVAAVACLGIPGPAEGAVVVNHFKNVAPGGGAVHDPHDPSSSGAPDLLSASSSDLAQGLTATVTYTGGSGSTMEEESAGESVWTNGSLATVYAEGGAGGNAVDHAAYGTLNATVGGSDIDAFVTFDLGASFNLSQIDVFLGWNDSGRDDSSFLVFVSTDNVAFSQIASYDKGGDDTGAITTPVTNLHRVVDDGGGDIAGGVRYVQLQFTDADNGYAGMVEVDVFGSPVPEPASVAFLGLGGLALLGRRRRQR